MSGAHWLVKSEPNAYSWDSLVKDERTPWNGVKNFAARNNLRAMKKGDLVLFYHSNEGKAVVGIAKVVRTAYPDAAAKEGDWSVVDLAPVEKLARPVSLAEIKADRALADMQLVTHSRLSVMSVSPTHFDRILALATTTKLSPRRP